MLFLNDGFDVSRVGGQVNKGVREVISGTVSYLTCVYLFIYLFIFFLLVGSPV